MTDTAEIGVFGGSGFYSLLEDVREVKVDTPYGPPSDSVFCADAATGTPVPIALKWNADSRIPNVLAVLPMPGKPLAPKTAYTCVITTAVTNALAEAVTPSADWVSVRDGASANPDADAIFDPVVTMLGTQGLVSASIAAMTVFTTQSLWAPW